uniref:4-hydroxybenzoate polyprenyltransferase, mitochondrial n=1 Tax=Panagrolaimus superbus TaxID=310955 RepID=A0A914YUB7_9BILA
MRADKPIGTWLLYWPCAWSIALAAAPGTLPDLKLLAICGTGAFLMRSAGCIINDLWDKDFDRQVERCATRPLASGELNTKQAITLLAGLLSASLGCLVQLNLTTIALGFTAIIPTILYPLAKRYTNWPQIVLGGTFNYGAIMGYTAVTNTFVPEAIIPLYLSTIFWTLVYDTIYAHQDKEDDIKIGVKSTALRLGEQTKPWLTAFSAGMITNLAFAGIMTNQTWPFFFAIAATSCHLGWQISTLQINNRSDCWNKFTANQWIGALIFSGIIVGTLLKE